MKKPRIGSRDIIDDDPGYRQIPAEEKEDREAA